jgi:hypothetical protein
VGAKTAALSVGFGALALLLLLQLAGREQAHFSTLAGVLGPDPVRAQRETYRANRHTVLWRHGWPLPFAERVVSFAGVYPGDEPWGAGRWGLWGGVIAWHPAAFALDLGLCGGVAVVFGWISWLRLSRRCSGPPPTAPV